jgi:hypothetical protein
MIDEGKLAKMTLLCVHDFATVDFILFYDLYAR